jgi:hypothetical protein
MGGASGLPSAQQPLVTIGDITVTQTQVHTPSGSYPLAGTHWTVQENVQHSESIPAWAIVLAVIFFVFCLLGLLFLLVKERKTSGYVQVGVQGPGFFHATQVPVYNALHVGHVQQQVNYVRSIVAAAGTAPPGQA